MAFILDNMSSLIVFAAVAFIVSGTQLRAQQETAQQTIVYMSKKQTLDFADLIEREFKIIGVGITGTKIESIATNGAGETSSFVFWRNDGAADLRVEYRLVNRDTVTVKGADVVLYGVERYENGVRDGGGPSTLSSFEVSLLDDAGSGATVSTATLVRIKFANVHALGNLDLQAIRQTHWGITLRPMNL